MEAPGHVGGSGKVRFPSEQTKEHDSEIVTTRASEDSIDVHLGFLQILHCYKITFSIKDNLSEDLTADPLQNLHAKVLEVKPSEDGEGHEVTIEFSAHKEKLLKEYLVLKDSADPTKELLLVLHSRVLGRGKGTPALKSGIHCIGINAEEDSDASDWQGFD